VISAYLDSLEGALRFDRSLSRSVRQEVEDHLREAVAADQMGDGIEAERRAIAKFGDPRALAAGFAVISLSKQTTRIGVAIILVIAGLFTAMKARLAWYEAMQWSTRDDLREISAVVGSVDRYSFWLSVFIAIVGMVHIGSRRAPPEPDATYCRHLHRFFVLCLAATASLVVSIICDGVLTAFRLIGAELGTGSLIPIVSMVIEMAFAGLLVFQVRSIQRRIASTAALLKT
jgi:HAAS